MIVKNHFYFVRRLPDGLWHVIDQSTNQSVACYLRMERALEDMRGLNKCA